MRRARTGIIAVTVSGGEASLCGTLPKGSAIGIMSVTGPDVSVRPLSDGDPILRRIMSNPDILCTAYPDRVCYVPKSPVAQLTESWKSVSIAGIVVGDGTVDTAEAVADVERSIPLETLCRQWYERLKLPVLLFYLAVLLVNFLITPSVGRKYDERRRQLEAAERQNRTETELSEKQRVMMAEYRQLSFQASAVSFDRIASCVPDNIRLTNISLEGDTFRIKGEAGEASSVVVFAGRLGDCFPSMKIQSFDKIPGREMSAFEIRVSR